MEFVIVYKAVIRSCNLQVLIPECFVTILERFAMIEQIMIEMVIVIVVIQSAIHIFPVIKILMGSQYLCAQTTYVIDEIVMIITEA